MSQDPPAPAAKIAGAGDFHQSVIVPGPDSGFSAMRCTLCRVMYAAGGKGTL